MATEIVMPRLSDTMETGTIAKWHKQEGEQVQRGEVIAEIETDKANMELESYASGILARISVGEGQSAGVGEPIAVVAADQEEAQSLHDGGGAAAQTAQQAAPTSDRPAEQADRVPTSPQVSAQQPGDGGGARQAAAGGPSGNGATGRPADVEAPARGDGARAPGERIKASPLARRLAEEQGFNLADIRGSGPGGRITKDDVMSFSRSRQEAPERPAPAPAVPTPLARPEALPAAATSLREAQPVEMTRMQQTIARRMTEARFSAPEFVLTAEFDMTEARSLLKSLREVDGAPRIGPNDLLIKAVALALVRHPKVNAGWENGTMMRYGRVNVANAVAIPDGLVAPVIFDADKKSLGQVATESKSLIEKAHNGKLAPGEYEGGTFTVSNLGMYGIDQFTPILTVPAACILGVGTMAPKPVVVDGEIVVRERMRVDLACDHRVINGAEGAEFLQTLRRLLEQPMLILL